MKSLEDRVAYLETQLMSHGIQDVEMLSTGFSPLNGNDLPSASTSPQEVEGQQPEDLLAHVALECMQPDVFTTSLVNRNGLSLLRSLLADPLAKALQNAGNSDHHSLLEGLPYETRAAMPPRDASHRLIDTYFEHCDFFSPIMSSKEDFRDMIEPLFDAPSSNQALIKAKFRALVVFGTAVLLLNRRDSSVPISRSEGYFAAAIHLFGQHPDAICTGDLDHLVNLLLIVQHCCFSSNLTAVWHFLGLATRLAVELNLHKEQATTAPADPSQVNNRRWLFWSTYVFERNLCVIIGRPYSIPDEAIETPLPDVPENDGRRALAHHMIKSRRMESEAHTTLNQRTPSYRATMDRVEWRNDMHRRLTEWHASAPPVEQSSQLAPAEIVEGIFFNSMVLLYYPSFHFPISSNDDLALLAQNASNSIRCYKQGFRAGKLRFYWRTVHNLFRSGLAVAYCVFATWNQSNPQFDLGDMTASLNSCSSILWGMVERYPPGKIYRDIFDSVVSMVTKQAQSADNIPLEPQLRDERSSFFDHLSLTAEGGDLPMPAMEALNWGFGEHSQVS